MVILILGMVFVILLHDQVVLVEDASSHAHASATNVIPAGWLLAALAGKLCVVALYGWYCRQTRRTLGTGPGRLWYRRMGWVHTLWPMLLLGMFAADLLAGWLHAVRSALGNGVLYDELVAMLPTLAAVFVGWWLYYPIDRRLRDAALIRRADQGLSITPTWTRNQYLLTQARHQLLVMLAPLLVIMAWSETMETLVTRGLLGENLSLWLVPIGAGLVFFAAPIGLRYVFNTVQMPTGSIREAMLTLCRQHGIRLRELLLWRTHGWVANAAVIGLAGPVRYVLLTDALLEETPRPMVEAVMAHELGHVRHKHLFTLLLAAIASLSALTALLGWALAWLPTWWGWDALAATGVLACWFPLFGWVSRQVERQADVFAVRHLQNHHFDTWKLNALAEPVFEPASVQTMVNALLHIAILNHLDTDHFDWRHGSIAVRASYLRSLVGRPIDALPVDTTVRAITLASFALLGAISVLAIVNNCAF